MAVLDEIEALLLGKRAPQIGRLADQAGLAFLPHASLEQRFDEDELVAVDEVLDLIFGRALLPVDLRARAHVRGLAQMLAMDAHPFIVPRVRKYLEQELHLDEPARMKWLTHWLDAGTQAIEDVLARDPRTGRFCCGDHPTIADICLVAHLTSAKMLCSRSPAPYPTARRIFNACMQIEAFALEHPLRQTAAQTTAPI
jgi:maleylacetoacetate isomerase